MKYHKIVNDLLEIISKEKIGLNIYNLTTKQVIEIHL